MNKYGIPNKISFWSEIELGIWYALKTLSIYFFLEKTYYLRKWLLTYLEKWFFCKETHKAQDNEQLNKYGIPKKKKNHYQVYDTHLKLRNCVFFKIFILRRSRLFSHLASWIVQRYITAAASLPWKFFFRGMSPWKECWASFNL